jgi:hypothetical protein
MAKKVIIEVEIEGTQEVLKLQNQIKATKKELKETKDIKAYDNLSADLVRLQSNLKEARKQQRQAVDAFTATDEGVGAYSRLSAQLRVARNRLKDLKAEGVTTGNEASRILTAQLVKPIARLEPTRRQCAKPLGLPMPKRAHSQGLKARQKSCAELIKTSPHRKEPTVKRPANSKRNSKKLRSSSKQQEPKPVARAGALGE